MWCEKHGFLFAVKWIPTEWLAEKPDQSKLTAIKEVLKCAKSQQ